MAFWKGTFRSPFRRIEELLQELKVDINEVLTKVQAQTTVIGSVSTLLSQLTASINDLKNHPVIQNDPALLAQVSSIGDQIDANNTALANAVAANTPAAPSA